MRARPLRWSARSGYAARGIVYLIVGGFAVLGAVGSGGGATGTRGALLQILDTGYGAVLLGVVGLGLLCYAVWRLFQSTTDADGHGTDAKGLAVRGGLLVSSATHFVLAFWALSVAIGRGGGGDSGSGGLAGWLMQQPFGAWLVAAVGVAIIGAGIAHIAKGVTKGYEKWFQCTEREMRLIRPVATVGLVARGIVFLIVGVFFIYAGVTVDPQEAGGLREALQWLRGQPYGSILFLLIAVGLTCFGAYSLIQARYRRIDAGLPLDLRRFA